MYVVPTINTVVLSARSIYPFKDPFGDIKVIGPLVQIVKNVDEKL